MSKPCAVIFVDVKKLECPRKAGYSRQHWNWQARRSGIRKN